MAIKTTELIRTSQSWDGVALPDFPVGKPELRVIILLALLTLTACSTTEEQLKQRANELCAYIPDHELLEKSRDYMTTDFYAVLDTMFHLPYTEDVLHEWEFWFVATDGTPVACCTCEILSIEQTDDSHCIARVWVHPEDTNYEADEHRLYMECVNGEWLIADYDEHKANAARYIHTWRTQLP